MNGEEEYPAAESASSGTRRRPANRVALALLTAYQGAASGRVSTCRFYPSCSNYAMEAYAEHGFWRASGLTARRLLRCRPFGPHGVDLVPLPVRADRSHGGYGGYGAHRAHERGRSC